jgi:hypothetical protein
MGTQPPGMAMGQPRIGASDRDSPRFGTCPQLHHRIRIVDFVLRVLLALSGIFALTSLGIFLLRRSKPRL